MDPVWLDINLEAESSTDLCEASVPSALTGGYVLPAGKKKGSVLTNSDV